MAKEPNKSGGGAQTNKNGLHFEQTTSLAKYLEEAGYKISNFEVFDKAGKKIGLCVPKHDFYRLFLVKNSIDFKEYNSKKWLPDEAFVNFDRKTVYIIEKKFQSEPGSVDEKLPNCEFKRQEYEKLCNPIPYDVKYYYILSDWFKKDVYRDTLQYVTSKGSLYFFHGQEKEFLEAIGLDIQ